MKDPLVVTEDAMAKIQELNKKILLMLPLLLASAHTALVDYHAMAAAKADPIGEDEAVTKAISDIQAVLPQIQNTLNTTPPAQPA